RRPRVSLNINMAPADQARPILSRQQKNGQSIVGYATCWNWSARRGRINASCLPESSSRRFSMYDRHRLLCVAALVIGFAPIARAQEWTRFRGPNGQGQSDAPTIPITWTENDYNWKVELPGIGHSSPVVWGDKVFLTSADPDTATLHVICLRTT